MPLGLHRVLTSQTIATTTPSFIMVTFLLPPSQTLGIAQCQNHLSTVRNEKEPLRIIPRRNLSKSPERVRNKTDSEGRPSGPKSPNRNSWFKSITLSLTSGGGSLRTEPDPPSPLDAPTHVRRRARSLLDPKVFTWRTARVEDPRLPDHMKRSELQLRRTQRQDRSSSKSLWNRRSSVDRTQKCPPWWPI